MTVYKKSNSGYLPFIQKNETASPFTDIQNRAKIDSSLKCSMGVERIHINSLNKLNKEVGPNGEEVYEPDNGDTRFRFVGSHYSKFDNYGLGVLMSNTTDYIEVAFYGTGLNILSLHNAFGRDVRVTIDGGIESANIMPSAGPSNFENRNYKQNITINLASGLSLDWHTVKVRSNIADTTIFFGFEILNEASQITVKAGKAHGSGYEYEVASDQLIDYNLGFDNVIDANVGTKGGRVITYVDPSDGTIKKRLTKVNAAPSYLASTDHTNEAPYRKINWREFGRNRADDFSTLTSSNSTRAFTLDDGTTTLIGANVFAGGALSGVLCNALNAYLTLTFVGTGLDLTWFSSSSTGTLDVSEIFVDGVSVGFLSQDNPNTNTIITESICSGLPYGTHTVKINTATDLGDRYFLDFTLYQPKKPTLPEGAVEITDYNIMADYDESSVVADDIDGSIPSGVLFKTQLRECALVGAGWSGTVTTRPDTRSGFRFHTSTNGNSVENTFIGTGAMITMSNYASARTFNIYVDGVLDDTGTFPYGNGVNNGGGSYTINATFGGGVSIQGLSDGLHTVKFEHQGGAVNPYIDGFYITTKTHTPHTTFGSRSMKDCRNFDSAKDVNKITKEVDSVVNFNTVNFTINSSKNISQLLSFGAGLVLIYLEETMLYEPIVLYQSNYPETVNGIIYGDGTSVFDYRTQTSGGAGTSAAINSASIKGTLQKDEFEE